MTSNGTGRRPPPAQPSLFDEPVPAAERSGLPTAGEPAVGLDTTATTAPEHRDAGPLPAVGTAAVPGDTLDPDLAATADGPGLPDDAAARDFAANPAMNVVLEASAGTGKTSVLVARYLNLLRAGIDPANILAITFTRKAAAEMRERIVRELRDAAAQSVADRRVWEGLRDRLGEIAISTIDAFCLALLREFPLEADVDPGFEMADETEVPRLVEESLDQALRIITGLARREPEVALVLAQLGLSRTREGLAILLSRRLVAWDALDRFLARGPAGLTSEIICRRTAAALQDVLRAVPGGLPGFLADGPVGHPRYQLLTRELARLGALDSAAAADVRGVLNRVASHFLTGEGKPRGSGAIYPYKADHYPSTEASRRHRAAVTQLGPAVERLLFAFNRDLNVVLARGIRRMFAIALTQYRRALEERSVLDFSDVLQRALDLLRQMDEFAQSRYRLESRYHHVLVDEFQDTSQAQWELVSLVVRSWGEGLGLATQPSVFIVGDRKQSIYRFRDADVTVMDAAHRFIEQLRPGSQPRRSIARSFRAIPELLAFVNDVFDEMSQATGEPGGFSYGASDRFPVTPGREPGRGPVLGLAVAEESPAAAAAVAGEVARVIREETVRDRKTGVARAARPGDIAIVFRSRASHRDFEEALERVGIPTYVYKGLGFFDADETKDVIALLRYLARPDSELRAAAFLRSRFVRLSDPGLATLAPALAGAMTEVQVPAAAADLSAEDQLVLTRIREAVARWLPRVDRVPPADLLEEILVETAYAAELHGARSLQAWENLKKMRAIVRRIQNRGYATLSRIADHLDALSAGDESNAVVEALDAVNLMTVHASKGLEFPVVFVVNVSKGASGPPRPVRVIAGGGDDTSVSIGPFVSEMDEAERDRERHETRRLLYVAFTRARDRLYLATVLKRGAFAPGRGSLGEVLPESIRILFGRAASALPGLTSIGWEGRSGHSYEFRLCPAPTANEVPETPPGGEPGGDPARRLITRPAPVTGERQTVSRAVAAGDWGDDGTGAAADGGQVAKVAGRLVHRLFQVHGVSSGPHADAADLLTARDRAEAGPALAGVVADANRVWDGLRQRADVREVLGAGQPFYEVPFSMTPEGPDGFVLRGTIDCLIEKPDGSVVVVEFKTGRFHPIHQRQLDVYLDAARLLFPGREVRGRLYQPEP